MGVIYEPRGPALEYSPLACNPYRGCVHSCGYCFAPACLRMTPEAFHAQSVTRPGFLLAMEKELRKLAGTDRRVLLCFTCDPYQPNEDGTTRKAIQLLNRYQVPFQVLTKGGTRATRDFDLYAQGDGVFATTLLFTDDADRAEWEPNAASVADRIEAIQQAHELGIRTWVSIEPVIDPAQAIALIPLLAAWVDEFRVGKLNHHPLAKTIDWQAFAVQVLDALQDSGRDYMVKDALASFLSAGAPSRHYADDGMIVETVASSPRQIRLF